MVIYPKLTSLAEIPRPGAAYKHVSYGLFPTNNISYLDIVMEVNSLIALANW